MTAVTVVLGLLSGSAIGVAAVCASMAWWFARDNKGMREQYLDEADRRTTAELTSEKLQIANEQLRKAAAESKATTERLKRALAEAEKLLYAPQTTGNIDAALDLLSRVRAEAEAVPGSVRRAPDHR